VNNGYLTSQILSLALPLAVFATVAAWLFRLLRYRDGRR
jgi:hypothetical protein